MEHKQSKNNHFLLPLFIVMFFMFFGCAPMNSYKPTNSMSGIHATVKKNPTLGKGYQNDKPIYITNYGLNPQMLSNIAVLLQEVGMSVTADKNAAGYLMQVRSYVTMPYKDGRAVPFESDFLLGIRDELPLVKPMLISSSSAEKEIMAMEKIVRASGESIGKATGLAVSAVEATGGGLFGLATAATMAVADTALSIRAKNRMQEGLAGFRFTIYDNSGNFKSAISSLEINTASTKEEHPVDLIKAAIERAAIELGVRK